MEEKDKNDAFIQALLEERDKLFQQNARLKSQLDSYAEVEAMKASYEKTINNKDIEIRSLKEQVERLLRQVWGKSSERFINEDPLQRRLDFDGLDLLPEEEELAKNAGQEIEEYKTKTVVVKIKEKPVRKVLPENLPRVEEHIYPENIDQENWVELEPVVTEILEHEPAKFYVRKIIRHVYAVKNKNMDVEKQVVTALMPMLPIAKSYVSSSLLAELVINKYVNHLPFHRQIQMFKQLGVSISSSTINDWFRESANLLRPLYYRLRELVLASDYIQVDETTIPIVHEEKHKTVKGYIWMVRAVIQNMVFFHYDQGSRAQKVVLGLLHNFQGALQTDGYEVYAMYENKKGVLPIGCWAHARRKFEEALKEDRVRAEYALTQIGMLYEVERRADQEKLSFEERAALRTRLSYPIMVAFEKWIVKEYPHVLPQGRIGKALKYTFKIYNKLSRYHLDGRYRIDNNLAENAIRPIALGRKNYLFCGNNSAAEDAAVMYSLLGCCKASEVNLRDWLVYVFDNIHNYDHDYSKDLAKLLPNNWKNKSKFLEIEK